MNTLQKYISELLDFNNMGITKKVCIFLFIVLGLAFFYQNHVLSQSTLSPLDATLQSNTYVSFREDLNGQSVSKYAVVDSNSNVQVNTLYTATSPVVVNPAEMVKDSRGKVHFSVQYADFFFNWASMRIFYQKEGSTAQEIIPFQYGNGMSFNFNGFLPWRQKMIMDSSNVPYVLAGGRTYTNGQITGFRIEISKRLTTGWTPSTVVFQTTTFTPMAEIAASFDKNSNIHVFYQLFTNPNCISITCPRSTYELVFDRSFNVISNNQIITFNGLAPEANTFKPITNMKSSRESYLAFLSIPNTGASNYNVAFATSKNSWSQQTLATSVVSPGSTFSTSLDMESIGQELNVVASEKNIPANTARILTIKSRNHGSNWITNTLLSSTTSQYRDIFMETKNLGTAKELNIAYTESNFGDIPQVAFSKLNLMRVKSSGVQTNNLVYQNPLGSGLMIGDLLVV